MGNRQSVEQRYTPLEIQRYEAIFGRNFVSPGGRDSAIEVLGHARLDPTSLALDVGCGLGGSAFYMAQQFGARVDGMDLSGAMIDIARERGRQEGLESHVRFFQANCLEEPYPSEAYDLVYSRDTFLHIGDRKRLFEVLRRHLKPSGQLLFTDYALGPTPPCDEFRQYISDHGYHLVDLAGYRHQLEQAGFEVQVAQDRCDRFIEHHVAELARVRASDLAAPDIDYLVDRWETKIERARRGEQSWVLFLARPLRG